MADAVCAVLERSYPAIPTSYYLTVLGGNLISATVLMMFWPLQLPVWGLCLAVLMAVAFLIPFVFAHAWRAPSLTSPGLQSRREPRFLTVTLIRAPS